MSVIKLADQIYSVGVLNPSLRVFDIVMESRYGTSYNAYLITGEKNVLVETVHSDFFDEYLQNIQSVVPVEKIDYLIMNHTEPDHSGSIARLLQVCPNLTVVCTAAAHKYLQNITNRSYQVKVVKDGEELALPGRTLRFLVSPMLHWPDSMFTYIPDTQTAFTCDFLGAHFCEPQMLDRHIRYPAAYEGEFAYYYNCIFGPFKPFVLSGLKKLEGLPIQMVCPSHGPVLVDFIPERMAQYEAWSQPAAKAGRKAVIAYATAYGYTGKIAESMFRAITERTDCSAVLVDMVKNPVADTAEKIAEADVLLVGACTINRDAPGIVWDVLSRIDAVNTKGKAAGAFGSYGWSGEAGEMMRTRLQQLKFSVPDEPYRVVFSPTEADLAAAGDYAVRVVEMAK